MRKGLRSLALVAVCLLVLTQAGAESRLMAVKAQTRAEEEAPQKDTLENQTVITGKAEPGTEIVCRVYTYDDKGRQTLLYQRNDTVGESGLYMLTVSLPVLGRQYVSVTVGSERDIYVYNRYRKQLVQDLQTYYLNVYELLEDAKS